MASSTKAGGKNSARSSADLKCKLSRSRLESDQPGRSAVFFPATMPKSTRLGLRMMQEKHSKRFFFASLLTTLHENAFVKATTRNERDKNVLNE
jgi:hypothetical protein